MERLSCLRDMGHGRELQRKLEREDNTAGRALKITVR